MSDIDKVISHFGDKQKRKIEIKEWEATYWIKPLTVAETRRLLISAKKDEVTMLVDAIIMKAEKENGDKAFSVADRDKLLNQADVEIVKTLGSFIVNEINPDDVKKNFD
tara:strand:- start:516 stop:842 length:327 start_codon:yes stop_codon:yes gene_type:complete